MEFMAQRGAIRYTAFRGDTHRVQRARDAE
jgi:hypothetical protein